MATSGTTAFAPDFADVIEDAFELAGIEMRSGYQFRTARRSLDLLMIEWANRGYNLWLIDDETTTLISGTPTKTLTASTIDIIDAEISIASVDYRMRRIPYIDYMRLSNKTSTGRPTSYAIDRQIAGPIIYLWPTPDQAYTLKYWRLRRIEDTGGATYTPDAPFRFLPALIAGLAHKLAAKDQAAAARVPFLEAEAEKQWQFATDEDRDKSGFYIRPRIARV